MKTSTKLATQDAQLRQKIAQTCARIMVEERLDDFHLAKQKALAQLGLPSQMNLPSNSDIEAELALYQRLFKADSHPQQLQHLRETAVQAMRLLADFSPRLVGPVLYGTATEYSEVTLHLFTYTPEDVAFFLMEQGIPYTLSERRYRMSQVLVYPSYHFVAGDVEMVLVVFGIDDIRWSPPSKLDGKPMRRANLQAVEALLAAG
jgi:hypothetical protein